MREALFGLVGVFVGAMLTWVREVWSDRRTRGRHARYLAIRVVCVLDRYIESCAEVVSDDGLCHGQRNEQGYLVPQIPLPAPPAFPEDLDWKSIEPSLMYLILSLPSRVGRALD